ncbi:leucyl/phenylalanyl-tRNA--protein transferase [Cognatilysobacter bugurensis]|nr:leucyl/phenylalanyl-tRNA--protein transferase [Lysobacter bugurensis]
MPLRPILLPADPQTPFPPVEWALREPCGLLAIGGDLSIERLLNAYRHGIFPWYSEGQPILWWSPDPRAVFETRCFALPSRFRRSLRQLPWRVTADQAFDAVINACASVPRRHQDGTWIVPEMLEAYRQFHEAGHAHSIEVWSGDRLVGGLYGVAIGRMFYGESMFSLESGASKAALGALMSRMREWGWPLLDAQVENPHLMQLGARRMPRTDFSQTVSELVRQSGNTGNWSALFGEIDTAQLAASRPALET